MVRDGLAIASTTASIERQKMETRRWFVHSATKRPDVEHWHGTAWPGPAQNWWVHDPGPDWLSSRVGGCPLKRPCACACSSALLRIPLRGATDHLREGEKIFAFLDDVSLVCTPDRVLEVFRIVENALWTHSKISVDCGKTHLWNRIGVTPTGSEELTRAAGEEHPQAVVWRGDQCLPVEQQGSPFWDHQWDTTSSLMKKVTEHQTLLERIPQVSDVQFAWLLCSTALQPEQIAGCAQSGPICPSVRYSARPRRSGIPVLDLGGACEVIRVQ